MALGTGYKIKCGIAKESIYGTLVAPTEVVPILPGESFNKSFTFAEQEMLKAKNAREVPDIIANVVNGSVSFEANYQEVDLFWALALGGVCTISGSGPYDHSIPIAEDIERSLSLHMEKDVNVFSFAGVKINTLTFTFAPDTSPATMDLDFVAKTLTQDTTHRAALAALNDQEKPRLLFHQALVRLGEDDDALASPTDDICVSNFVFTLNENLVVDQRCTTTGKDILEPLRHGRRDLTITMTIPRYDSDQLRTWQTGETNLQMDVVFTSGNYSFSMEMPTLRIKDWSALAGDAGIIPVEVTLQAYRNDGNTPMAAITEEIAIGLSNDRSTAIWT